MFSELEGEVMQSLKTNVPLLIISNNSSLSVLEIFPPHCYLVLPTMSTAKCYSSCYFQMQVIVEFFVLIQSLGVTGSVSL